MLFFLYQVAVLVVWLVSLPRLLWVPKYREGLRQRMGRDLPQFERGKRPLVWIHAVSFGEVRAIAPLAKLLSGMDIVVSTVTQTGQLEARRAIPGAKAVFYLPFDLWWWIAPLVKRLRPEIVILSEGDIWPAFQRAVVKHGGRVVIASGKLSERSAQRMRLPFMANFLLQDVSKICVQNEIYRQRFLSIGYPQNQLIVTGNLKFDGVVSKVADLSAWREQLGLESGEKVVVLGSTHAPEEEWLLDAFPEGKILLVPRHPERFDAVAALLSLRKESYFRLSEGGSGRVVLVDCMGKLRDCYEVADLAVVGGSFVPHIGGHNILEPCDYGVPVLFGPHMEAQLELVELVLRAKAGQQVTREELPVSVDPAMGERGLALMATLRGAVARTLEEIL